MKYSLKPFESILGVTDSKVLSLKDRETLYSAAYGMYQVGDYENAANIFTKLTLHDPFDGRFWKGLAATRQMQKQYEAALKAWAVSCLLSQHCPTSHFHAAECYLSLKNAQEAKNALECAEKNARNDPDLTKKIKILKEVIQNA